MKETIDKRTVYGLPEAEISHWETNIPCRETYIFESVVITHMLAGTKHLCYGAEALVFPPNSILLPPTDENIVVDIHEASFKDPVECITLEVDRTFVQDFYFELCDRYNLQWADMDVQGNLSIDSSFFSLEENLYSPFEQLYKIRSSNKEVTVDQKFLIETKLKELVFKLLRTKARGIVLQNSVNKYNNWLSLVLGYIKESYNEEIKISLLADIAGKSVSNFYRAFKDNMGCTPNQYIIMERIKNSQKKLMFGNDPIQQVAFSSGFNSVEHFSRKFRTLIGKTPKTFRKESQVPSRDQ